MNQRLRYLRKRIAQFDPAATVRLEASRPAGQFLFEPAITDVTDKAGQGVRIGAGVQIRGGRSDVGRGVVLGDRVHIGDDCRLSTEATLSSSRLEIGDDCRMGPGTVIDGSGGVSIAAGSQTGSNCHINGIGGVSLGARVQLGTAARITFDRPAPAGTVVIGDGTRIGDGSHIEGSGGVEIGAGCIIEPNCVISSTRRIDQHHVIASGEPTVAPIRIGRNVYLGANVVVMAGVTIGDDCVISPCTVVSGDVASGSFIAPAGRQALTAHRLASMRVAGDTAASGLTATLKTAIQALLEGTTLPVEHVASPLPFSRASARDYAQIVDLFKADPGRDFSSLAPRPCPACAKNDHRHLFNSYDGYPFHVCNSCGAWFVPMQVTDTFIEGFFQRVPEARTIADRMMASREQGTRDSDRTRFTHYFDLARLALDRVTGEPIRYLDIGCGVGHSVELASELGMHASGVEVNPVALQIAKSAGRNVRHPSEFADEARFHFVTLFETLEHITAPDEVLSLAARRLAPGGLVMITVPNRGSWELSLKRQASLHIFGGTEGVGHINLLDARSLRVLLERHGLTLLHTDGQYGSNLLDVFDTMLDSDRDGAPSVERAELQLTIPKAAHGLLNALGPYIAELDRLIDRAPILIGIACRADDAARLAEVRIQLERLRKDEILNRLS